MFRFLQDTTSAVSAILARWRIGLVVGMAGWLSGCNSSGTRDTAPSAASAADTTSSSPSAEHPILVVHSSDSPAGGNDSIVRGELSLSPDGRCIFLGGQPVVWPAGTLVSADPIGVRLPNGELIALGEVASGAGGEHAAASVKLPEGCESTTTKVWVFATDADVQPIPPGP